MNIDIADILESEISVNIDIGNGDIDPALVSRTGYSALGIPLFSVMSGR